MIPMEKFESIYDTRIVISLSIINKESIDLFKQFIGYLNAILYFYNGNTKKFLCKELQYNVDKQYESVIKSLYSKNDEWITSITIRQLDYNHPHFIFYVKLLSYIGLESDIVNIIYRSDKSVGNESLTNDLYGLLTFHNQYKFTSFYEVNPKPIYNFYKGNSNSPYIKIDNDLMIEASLFWYLDSNNNIIIESNQETEIYFDNTDALNDFISKIFGVKTEAVNNSIRYVEYKELYQVDSDLVY